MTMTSSPSDTDGLSRERLEAELFSFFTHKYVQSADERQKSMGLTYTEAETHDLAKEVAWFIASRTTGTSSPKPKLDELLQGEARQSEYDWGTSSPEGSGEAVAWQSEVLRLLALEDERQTKIHDLLETIREQIRLEVAPEHRPASLFTNIQNIVYAMRGRMPLMNDAAIVGPLTAAHPPHTGEATPASEAVAWSVRDGKPDNEFEEGSLFEVMLPNGVWRGCIAVDANDARETIREEWDAEQKRRAAYDAPSLPQQEHAPEGGGRLKSLARDMAVSFFDGVHGYTMEFAADPAYHEAQYDFWEEKFYARLSTALEPTERAARAIAEHHWPVDFNGTKSEWVEATWHMNIDIASAALRAALNPSSAEEEKPSTDKEGGK